MDKDQSASSTPPTSASALVLTAGVALAFFTALSGATTLWHEEIFPSLISFRHGLTAAAVCLAISLLLRKSGEPLLIFHLPTWAGMAFLFFLSDWLPRRYTFFHGAPVRGELLLCAALMAVLIRSNRVGLLKALLPIAILLIGGLFVGKIHGGLLFSDDLASFLYRLSLLKERFPHIPFYNPQWNGGIDQRDFFATGVLNIFFLAAPIIYLFNLVHSFNWVVGALLFIITPGATAWAALALGYNRLIASIAGTLAMTSGLLWYKWALSFGTLGFITSAALFPLFLAFASRFISKEHVGSLKLAVFIAALTTLIVLWSPAGLALVPTLACFGLYLRTVLQKRHSITAAILVVALNLPWMVIFWSVSNVGSFVHPEISQNQLTADTQEESSEAQMGANVASPPLAHIKQVIHPSRANTPSAILRETAIFTNPFLLILIPAGILLLPTRTRLLYGATAAWLVCLGTIVAPFRPQLELERMLVILGIVGAIPAAVAFEKLLRRASQAPGWRGPIIPTAAVGSFLLLGPFGVTNFLEQRTLIRYHIADPIVREMTEAIQTWGGNGRVLFSGFILHEVSGGHIAPFPLMTDKPLMASSHVHNLWHYKDIFPQEYESQGDSSIRRFLDLYNVTAVFAHEKRWQEYFKAHPAQFTQVWQRGRFILFTRQGIKPSYFLSGKGQVLQQSSHSITLSLETSEATIKFNYFPFLTASTCTIKAAPQPGEISLIALSNCPVGIPITIESTGVLSRLRGLP
ncbi:MAG: hypothetical protein EBZ48_02545 [Proteobacteria bacterium]|nr:hypothetical protein [Pseudomonadota bacterium]